MAIIELVADDFCDDGKCVKIGNVASAIAKRFLADGSPNKFQAERDAWPLIHTGIVAEKLHVLDQVNRQPLSADNSGDGMVLFDDLVEWGKWCKRFDFVKQATPDAKTPHPLWVERVPECDANGKLECKPDTEINYFARNAPEATSKSSDAAAKGEHVPLFPLLDGYWDKPLSELPEELRARVSMQKDKRLVGQQPKFDASGELECDADGYYPAWEGVYVEHETGDWNIDWDALTPEQRQEMARQIDYRHAPKTVEEINESERHFLVGFYSIKTEWDLWADKPTLVADEAIPLMNGLDPGSWRNRHNRTSHQQFPDEWVAAIERGFKIAEGEKVGHQSPADWLAWGRSHGLDQPTMKSGQRLREPDICMWPLFAKAVEQFEKQKPKTDTVEQLRTVVPEMKQSIIQCEAGNPATHLIEEVIEKMTSDTRKVTPSTIWVELGKMVGKSIIVDTQPDSFICDIGEDDSHYITKDSVRGILTRWRARQKHI